jgi:hypothetical protein
MDESLDAEGNPPEAPICVACGRGLGRCYVRQEAYARVYDAALFDPEKFDVV